MEKTILISPADTDRAYQVYCRGRFRALQVAKVLLGLYAGDELAMEMFTAELRKEGVKWLD
jgi:hypothetical protein